jgi:hypothetical protein
MHRKDKLPFWFWFLSLLRSLPFLITGILSTCAAFGYSATSDGIVSQNRSAR